MLMFLSLVSELRESIFISLSSMGNQQGSERCVIDCLNFGQLFYAASFRFPRSSVLEQIVEK